jgi:hypothetical protein
MILVVEIFNSQRNTETPFKFLAITPPHDVIKDGLLYKNKFKY